ncbi:Gliding motility-associated lipoprotein GldH [Croceitalea dokdonensis DOKDO 023]|uniref:Gliding motility-associated lipoprotein GldH n=1 Tax=Croceitalea dokdonensis DOKDO 023 TaxID=1300341 RepID=A0A0P7ASU0_9FLAO|nr:Gliding motility-associated lipoprotein GldH [Croceitalea dokdonensis DOKDO 023]
MVVLVCLMVGACSSNTIYSEYTSLNNGRWKASDTLQFQFKSTDSLYPNHVYINVRNNNEFEFSNLFLITKLETPLGDTTLDTLEFEMAAPDGSWLGNGRGSIKESRLWYRENIVFKESGVYTFNIVHAMRKNGEVRGMESLKGITDVGLEIEKSKTP